MSLLLMVDVMTKVDVPRPQQAVLLAMADHANDDGSSCFPSVDRIAWKLGYKPRQVTSIVRDLRRAGVLIEVAPASQHRPTEYRIDLSAAPPKPDFETWKAANSRHKTVNPGVQFDVTPESRGAISLHQGCNLTSSGVQFDVTERREIAPEPSIEPSGTVKEPSFGENNADDGPGSAQPDEPPPATTKPPAGRAHRLPEDWWPADDEIARVTSPPDGKDKARLGLPVGYVESETARFVDYWVGEGKPKVNWIATWRGWLRREMQAGRAPVGAKAKTQQRPPAARSSAGPYLPTDDVIDWDEEARRAEERRRERIAEVERRGAAGPGAGSHRRKAAALPGGTHRPVRVA